MTFHFTSVLENRRVSEFLCKLWLEKKLWLIYNNLQLTLYDFTICTIMSESEIVESTDQEVKLEHNPRKRVRHRKKQLYENILKQMEFYFSDANLTKDRFLGDLVKTNPHVPLEVFLKFNKIRSMTQDVTDIAKAMKNSTLLELSEDRLKVFVLYGIKEI